MNKVIVFYYNFTFRVNGFRIFNSRQEFEDILTKYLEKYPTPRVCVRTNMIIEYDNEENFFRSFSPQLLSDEEYKTIKGIFGTEYGFFPKLNINGD